MTGQRRLGIALGPMLTFCLSATALAQTSTPPPPSPCSTPIAIRAYNAGLISGASLVQAAWNAVNDCDFVEYFQDIVIDDVTRLMLPPGPSLYTACRYAGTIDGVYNRLDQLWGTCENQCFVDGQMAGQISGEAYCMLSIALGGLASADEFIRGAVHVCGFQFEVACDSEFIQTTKTYENLVGVCLPYTENLFMSVWNQARNNQCAYNPLPPPPPLPLPLEKTRENP